MRFRGNAHRQDTAALMLGLALVGTFVLSMGRPPAVEGAPGPAPSPFITRWPTIIVETPPPPTPKPTEFATEPPVETIEPGLTRRPTATPISFTPTATLLVKPTRTATNTGAPTATGTTTPSATASATGTTTATPSATTSGTKAPTLSATVTEISERFVPSANVGDILITEVQYDTGGGVPEPSGEWVEIYNTTGGIISLVGWTICDNAGCDSLSESIGPGEFAIIAADETTFNTFYTITGTNVINVGGTILDF